MARTDELPATKQLCRSIVPLTDESRADWWYAIPLGKPLVLQVVENRSARNSRASVDQPKSGAPSGSPVELS